MHSTSLVYCPHPLTSAGRQVLAEPFMLGESIAAYLDRQGVRFHQPVLLALDGDTVPMAEWGNTYPRPGQTITARALVRGDGGGSDPVRTILQIAVALTLQPVFAWGSIMSGSKIVGAMVAGAYAIGAGALINAIAPIPQPNLARAGGLGSAASPTYALTGSQNRARLYEPLPLALGRHRMYPDAGAAPFTEYEGEDQYLYQVFNFGFGDLRLFDFKIGDTPLSNFSGVEYWISSADGRVPNFPGNVDTLTVSTALTSAAGWQQRTSSASATQLGVDIAGQLYYAGDNGITTRSATLEIEYRKVGDSTWIPAVYSTVANLHSNYWSAGVTEYDWSGNPYWRQLAYGTTVAGDHYAGEPYAGGGTWFWRPYSERGYDAAPPQTYYTQVAQLILSNASSKPVRRTVRWTVPEGQYEVRARRATADETDARAVSGFEWSVLRTYQPDATDYTGQTRLGLRIRASGQLNGVIDQFNTMVDAWVPAWNGSAWGTQYTSNPAWLFLYFARGKFDAAGRRLFGAGLPDARIDIDAIKEWAVWCDSKGLTFNGILDRAMTCTEVLAAIARCGRASPTWATGKIGVVWDEGGKPVTNVYGMANIKAGSFSIDYITDKLADEVIVRFVNPALDYKPDTIRATVPGVSSPVNPQTVDLFGCTNQAMAGKEALLIAASQYYHRRRITWETDLEGMVNQRGDVVLLSHDLTQWSYSGRLVAGSTSVLTLSRAVPFTEGESHYVMLRHPNGTMETHAVVYQAGESDTIALNGTTLTAEPDAGRPVDWLWFFAPMATPGKKVRIVNIQPLDRDHVRITAVDEEAGYYAAEAGAYTYLPPTSFTELQPKVTNLACSEDLLDMTGLSRVHITWTARNASGVRLRLSIDGQPSEDRGTVYGSSYAIDLRAGQTLRIEVRPVALVDLAGVQTATLNYTVLGLNALPDNVTGFVVTRREDRLRFFWQQVDDLDMDHYEIRRGTSWAGSVFIGAPTAPPFEVTSAQGGTYLIKAVDTSGRMSQTAAVIIMSTEADINIIVTHDEADGGWNGTKINVIETAAGIELAGTLTWSDWDQPWETYVNSWAKESVINATGTYESEVIALGAVLTSRIEIDPVLEQVSLGDTWSAWGQPWNSYGAGWTWQGPTGIVSAAYQIATSTDGATWSDWATFVPGDYAASHIKFLVTITTADASYNGLLSQFNVTVDVPDRVIEFEDEAIPLGGKTLTFSPAFNIAPVMSFALQGGAIGDTIRFTSKGVGSVHAEVFDSSGISKAGNADITARAY